MTEVFNLETAVENPTEANKGNEDRAFKGKCSVVWVHPRGAPVADVSDGVTRSQSFPVLFSSFASLTSVQMPFFGSTASGGAAAALRPTACFITLTRLVPVRMRDESRFQRWASSFGR
jgi:hypothetical protein